MSSILEALKKLEEEKAARRGGGGNIAGKVTAAGRRPRQKPGWHLPAGMAAVAVAAVLVTYAVMGGFSPRPGETVSPGGIKPASAPPTIPAPLPAAPDGRGAAPAAVLPLSTQQGAFTAPATARAHPAPVTAMRQPAPPPSSEKLVPAEQTAASAQPAAGAQLPAFTVSGIAWQKDSASRLAVVNGVSVAEGNMIEGAQVREILPDRVLFSLNRTEFEVSLGKGAP